MLVKYTNSKKLVKLVNSLIEISRRLESAISIGRYLSLNQCMRLNLRRLYNFMVILLRAQDDFDEAKMETQSH